MENEYIGPPKNFHHMEDSESMNFRKTFDLNGTQNDEMLRLYLRKAGLSDEIERLTIEQRRAFIYDIIKSNKMPGYWMPSTMKNSATPTPSITSSSSGESSSRRPSNDATMRSSFSCGSLQNLNAELLPPRFMPLPATPTTPSTFVKSRRGKQYEISGPINFQHTAGDMARDMTRNAFDLCSSNDNVLRKYLIEKGISKDDIVGIRKNDLIRKIVQSKFTWMPTANKNFKNNTTPTADPHINYATISGYPEHRRSRAPLNIQPSPNTTNSKTDFSKYTVVSSPKSFPSTDEVNNQYPMEESNVGIIELPPLPPGTQLPEPPPRKSQLLPTIKKNVPPPPPSLVIAVHPNGINGKYQTQTVEDYDNNFSLDPMHSMKAMKQSNAYEPLYATIQAQPLAKRNKTLPAISPKPLFVKSLPPRFPKASIGCIPQPPPLPPPLPMKNTSDNRVLSPSSNNLNSADTNNFITPPPAPPISRILSVHSEPLSLHQIKSKKAIGNNTDDSRGELLESIRNGVMLKKIDQKAATISGVKPRTERRPQVLDFLTELKMGITLRRMNNPDDIPFTSNETSEC